MTDARESERAVIGCILIDFQRVMPLFCERLKASQFSEPFYADCYRAALDAYQRNQTADVITMLSALQNWPQEDAKVLLAQSVEQTPSAAQAKEYATLVANAHKARCAETTALQLLEGVQTPAADGEQVNRALERAADELSELTRTGQLKRLIPLKEAAVEAYQRVFDQTPDPTRLDTGFAALDSVIDGIYGGDLAVIAARPGVGKSAFALQLATSAARQGKEVLFYSLEMSKEQLAQRLLCRMSNAPLGAIKNAQAQAYSVSLAKAADKLARLPIYINDSGALTVQDIRHDLRTRKQARAVIVDYLQLMQTPERANTRNDYIGAITRGLKILAKDFSVPVVALSQLNRAKEETARPTLSDLRDSGNIEQDATMVAMLWKYRPEQSLIGVSVAKNRQGSTGTTLLQFDGARMNFIPSAERYIEQQTNAKWGWQKEG